MQVKDRDSKKENLPCNATQIRDNTTMQHATLSLTVEGNSPNLLPANITRSSGAIKRGMDEWLKRDGCHSFTMTFLGILPYLYAATITWVEVAPDTNVTSIKTLHQRTLQSNGSIASAIALIPKYKGYLL